MRTPIKFITVLALGLMFTACSSEARAEATAAAVQPESQPESQPAGAVTTQHVTIPIEGMACESCSEHLAQQLGRITGVITASVDFSASEASVEFDSSKVTVDKLVEEINKAFTAGKPTKKGEA